MLTAAAVRSARSAASYIVSASFARWSRFMPTMVSRIERRVPAARIAPNDEPYSTMRRLPRSHQTRCGMWCTSGCAPVAIDVRHTGVSDGNVVTARRYSPASARAESVGVERSPTAFSNVDGVRPSMTIRIAGLLRKRAQARVLPVGALARTQRDDRDRNGLDEAEERDQRHAQREQPQRDEDRRGPSWGPATANRVAGERSRAEARQQSGDRACDAALPVDDEPAERAAHDESHRRRARRSPVEPRKRAADSQPERNADAGRDADQPEVVHESRSVVSARRLAGKTIEVDPAPLPMLVFFTRSTSGPARRMESLLAHVERKERDRLRIRRVDSDEHPELVDKFEVDEVPSLVLVVEQRVVARLAGRANMPQIEQLIELHLAVPV